MHTHIYTVIIFLCHIYRDIHVALFANILLVYLSLFYSFCGGQDNARIEFEIKQQYLVINIKYSLNKCLFCCIELFIFFYENKIYFFANNILQFYMIFFLVY